MLCCQRVEAGLRNPPKDYNYNDRESSDFAINYGVRIDKKTNTSSLMKLRKLRTLSTVMQIVPCFGRVRMTLQVDLSLLLYLMITRLLTHAQRLAKQVFFSMTEDDKKLYLISETVDRSRCEKCRGIELSASKCDTKVIPLPILEKIFSRVNDLIFRKILKDIKSRCQRWVVNCCWALKQSFYGFPVSRRIIYL